MFQQDFRHQRYKKAEVFADEFSENEDNYFTQMKMRRTGEEQDDENEVTRLLIPTLPKLQEALGVDRVDSSTSVPPVSLK